MARLGERIRNVESYWSFANLVREAIGVASLVAGGAALTLWGWVKGVISPYGSFGFAIATLVFAAILAFIFWAVSTAIAAWRRHPHPQPTEGEAFDREPHPDAEESGAVIAGPEVPPVNTDPAIEVQAKEELELFVVDFVVPAVFSLQSLYFSFIDSQIDDGKIRGLASAGVHHVDQHHRALFYNYLKISWIGGSPSPNIPLPELIDIVKTMEKNYGNVCHYLFDLAKERDVDFLSTTGSLLPHWRIWANHHNNLVDNEIKIRRASRFGKLYRPAGISRWGVKVPVRPSLRPAAINPPDEQT